jgi:hypothetical protein
MRFAALFVAILTCGCTASKDPRLAKVDALEKDVSELKETVASLQTAISAAEVNTDLLRASLNPYDTAVFDPANSHGYSRLDTTGGTFLVSIKNVQPYVDGFRVTCNFGNPSSATFAGFKLKTKWGPRRDFKKMKVGEWEAQLREKELALTDTLRAGSWNPISFVLSPAKPEEFGYLELSVETNTISLAQR